MGTAALAAGLAAGLAFGAEPPKPAVAQGAPAEAAADKKTAPREKILEPYTDDKCLKNCHGEPGFGEGGVAGGKRNLFLDAQLFALSIHGKKGLGCIDCHPGADPNFHPRTGYPEPDCRACHSRKEPAGLFPPGALALLDKKRVERPPEKSRCAESWLETAHGQDWVNGRPGAPFCSDCHTAHAVFPTAEPQSTVNPARLVGTCADCHAALVRDYGIGGVLARFRVAGHGKGDLSADYSPVACLSCHQGEGAHGEQNLVDVKCPVCHVLKAPDAPVASKTSVRFHLKADPEAGGLTARLRLVYTIVFWGGVGCLAAFVLILAFSTLFGDNGRQAEVKDRE